MRYWKCVEPDNSDMFMINKIYETNDNGDDLTNDKGYTFSNYYNEDYRKDGTISWINEHGYKLIEVTRKEYLKWKQDNGETLEFNLDDFKNGYLAVGFENSGNRENKWFVDYLSNYHKYINNSWSFSCNYKDDNYLYIIRNNNIEMIGSEWEDEVEEYESFPYIIIHKSDFIKEEKESKMEENIKVGDMVRILHNKDRHGIPVGSIVPLADISKDKTRYYAYNKTCKWIPMVFARDAFELVGDTHEICIKTQNNTTIASYVIDGELQKKSEVKLYYKDEFDFEVATQEVLKKLFKPKTKGELFEEELENKLGHKPSDREIIDAYRKELFE